MIRFLFDTELGEINVDRNPFFIFVIIPVDGYSGTFGMNDLALIMEFAYPRYEIFKTGFSKSVVMEKLPLVSDIVLWPVYPRFSFNKVMIAPSTDLPV